MWLYACIIWVIATIIGVAWIFYDINRYQASVEDVYEDGEVEKIYRYKDKKGDWVTVYKLKSTKE